ncbi:carbohydrate ABC transporter permease [Kineosporia mesophila]|uniref:Carbohydrate ABC transporter permease n=1 Tax=Kineosporia mesophila TaxID=566012 RepID=A0ABP6ZIW5_9ACTN|nr:carbohydrate ABC transporter permease [Kineosporia mesophila]MCD5353451.1 carbohydrate ABC transporter permease [Kineosporia mesophila]
MTDQPDRGIISSNERRKPWIRKTLTLTEVGLLGSLVVIGLGPLLWLAKAATTPTRDTLREPMALWPNGFDIANLATAWNHEHLDRYFLNTLAVAGGSWASQLLVATTAGYALSVLRPRYGKLITGLVLGTMLVPAVVLLVPLYLTALDVPGLHISLINSWWAVWLPAAASPFNVILVKRFFDNLPREVFEAAMVDGAGPFRLFWSIVLPMSRPILGVVSVFAVVAAWKDFLWPLLVLPDPGKQPLSVRLPILAETIQLDVLLAALFISTLIPVVLFLVFQGFFLRGAGLSGAVKG